MVGPLEGICEPLQTFVQSVTSGGASGLDKLDERVCQLIWGD